ncbi:hypothetical protein HDV01_001988 [Terramyces sp. JEL0728]|nr:hypothetical protein HDV01_001988 [Terramyces sp. JEL0728]
MYEKIAVGVVVLILPIIGFNLFRPKPAVKKNEKPDHVYLYQFGRSQLATSKFSGSPFCCKLEAFMLLNNIPYTAAEVIKSATGRLPYIVLNGETIGDSSLIIKRLSEKYNIEQDPLEAVPYFHLIENSLYFVLLYLRWNNPDTKDQLFRTLFTMSFPLNHFLVNMVCKGQLKRLQGQGYADFDVATITEIGKRDLDAVENALKKNEYLLGDKLHEVDLALFGMLDSIMYHGFTNELVHHAFKSKVLVSYYEKISKKINKA